MWWKSFGAHSPPLGTSHVFSQSPSDEPTAVVHMLLHSTWTMKISPILSSIALAIITSTSAQEQYTDYQDYADGYEQDNLYENYAMQHDKAAGGGGWVLMLEFGLCLVDWDAALWSAAISGFRWTLNVQCTDRLLCMYWWVQDTKRHRPFLTAR